MSIAVVGFVRAVDHFGGGQSVVLFLTHRLAVPGSSDACRRPCNGLGEPVVPQKLSERRGVCRACNVRGRAPAKKVPRSARAAGASKSIFGIVQERTSRERGSRWGPSGPSTIGRWYGHHPGASNVINPTLRSLRAEHFACIRRAYACAPGAEKRRERIVRGQRGSDKKESPAGVWARRD